MTLRGERDDARVELAKAERERDEMQRKGESLCAWIGLLLTSLNISTPAAACEQVAALQADLAAMRGALRRYGRHADAFCNNQECICGLEAALALPPPAPRGWRRRGRWWRRSRTWWPSTRAT